MILGFRICSYFPSCIYGLTFRTSRNHFEILLEFTNLNRMGLQLRLQTVLFKADTKDTGRMKNTMLVVDLRLYYDVKVPFLEICVCVCGVFNKTQLSAITRCAKYILANFGGCSRTQIYLSLSLLFSSLKNEMKKTVSGKRMCLNSD